VGSELHIALVGSRAYCFPPLNLLLEVDLLVSGCEAVIASQHDMPGSSSSEDDDRVEHLHFKLVLLGDQGVGKTAIATRLTTGEFNAQ
jgi:hypothetical protein